MNELDVDMDELEARLYGQVYHMSNVNEDFQRSCEIHHEVPMKSIPRYFEQKSSRQQMPPPPPANFFERMGLYPIPVLNPPVNNIVVLPSPPTQIFTRPQEDSQKWLEKILERIEKTRLKNRQKRARRRKRKEMKNELKQKRKQEKTAKHQQPTTTADTIKPETVLIIDDSDADTNASDVILIEAPSEIIAIDCEDDVHKISEEAVTSDFSCQKDGLSPIKNQDNSEVPSSNSSTIDYMENLRETKLNEVNARSNNSFSELNLESFTNYIGGNEKTGDAPTLSSSRLDKNKHRKSLEKRAMENSSDSSSESEYENDNEEYENVSDVSITAYSSPKKQQADASKLNKEVEKPPDNKKIRLEDDEVSVIEVDTLGKDSIIFIDDDDKDHNSLSSTLKESDKEIVNSAKILNVDGGEPEYPEQNQEGRSKKFMDYWSEDMDKFYRQSWGHETFSVAEQQKLMSDNPKMWKIIHLDRVNVNCLPKQPRCRRCREFGHVAVKCTKRLQPPKCIICGASGHFESRCPNKMCTSCGQKSNYFTTYCSACARTRNVSCSICAMKGHLFYNCPDLWRRYLFTTTDGEVVPQPAGADVKQVENRWCSGCGENGHFEQSCGYYNRSHLPTSVHIHDYSDVYTQQTNPVNNSRNEDDTNLTWQLTPKEQRKLLVDGPPFLNKLERMLKVKVFIDNRKICVKGGSNPNKNNAKLAINRYCNNQDIFSHLQLDKLLFQTNACNIENLENNLCQLKNQTINWQKFGQNIFNELKSNPNKELYKKLNTVINAKLQVGESKQHMNTLEDNLRKNKKISEESFRYIFDNGNKMSENYYGKLIGQLPSGDHNHANSKYYEVETLKATVLKMGDRVNSIVINKYYNSAIIKNYSEASVTLFRKVALRMLSSKSFKRKNPLSKRDLGQSS